MPLDSPILSDGDTGFVGYASRINPLNLPAGMLQLSENMRLDRGVARTRKGIKRLADNINPSQVPLTVPFDLSATPEIEATNPTVRSSYSGGIFSVCVMRSPDEVDSTEVIVLAGSDRAYTYLTDGSIKSSAAWGAGVLGVDENGDGETEDDLVTAADSTGEQIALVALPAELTYPTTPDENIEETDKVSMLQAFDRLYIFREADTTLSGWETKYTSANGISVSGTTATVDFDAAHGYPAGATVRMEGSSVAAFDGHEYRIVSAAPGGNTDQFTITVPSGTSSAVAANIKVRRVKPPLYWNGVPGTNFDRATTGIPDVGISYRRLRSTAWANYINNRLIVPDGKQNLMLSDILDPDVFDPYWQSFRVGVGGNDRVMAVHPWVEGNFLVFCRKSIWIATVEQYASPSGGAFTIETGINRLDLLTDEIGCSARRTIQTAGSFIYFLSDSGVYRLDTQLDLKLRGNTKPLSDPISDQLSGLNSNYVYNSVGLFHENRYYIAVPSAGSTINDAVFIYNQLNEQWETQDIYGVGVNDFIVSDINGQRRVLISNQAGKLMLLDEVEEGDESPDASIDTVAPVPGKITTRRYSFGSMSAKRFTRVTADAVLPDTGAITVTANLRNPDKNEVLVPGLANTTGSENDYSLKLPIRHRAHFAEITIETTAERPEIRTVGVEAAGASLPPTDTKIAA